MGLLVGHEIAFKCSHLALVEERTVRTAPEIQEVIDGIFLLGWVAVLLEGGTNLHAGIVHQGRDRCIYDPDRFSTSFKEPSALSGQEAWKSRLLLKMAYMQPCCSITRICLCSFSQTLKEWCSFCISIVSSSERRFGYFGSMVGKLQELISYSLPSISTVPFP